MEEPETYTDISPGTFLIFADVFVHFHILSSHFAKSATQVAYSRQTKEVNRELLSPLKGEVPLSPRLCKGIKLHSAFILIGSSFL